MPSTISRYLRLRSPSGTINNIYNQLLKRQKHSETTNRNTQFTMEPSTSTSTPPRSPIEHTSDPDSPNAVPDASMFLPPARIPTIGDAYKTSELRPPLPDQIRYQHDPSLLTRISLWQGDITRLQVDSIVNAANKSLLGGGGVDGAIHFAAGRQLFEECRTLNGCMTGQAKITRGYNLPSRHVIHTVGPVYSPSAVEEVAQLLGSCYRKSLELAVENNARHIAFPSISTGIYGYPIVDATKIALDEVRRFCDADTGKKLDRVIFVVWSDKDKAVYESRIPQYFPPASENEQASDGPVQA